MAERGTKTSRTSGVRRAYTKLLLVGRSLRSAFTHVDFMGEAGRRLLAGSVFVLVAGLVAWASPAGFQPAALGLVAGANLAALAYLMTTWRLVLGGGQERARRWAISQDAPRSRALQRLFGKSVGVGLAVVVSVAGFLLASSLATGVGAHAGTLRVLSGLAVIQGWLVVLTTYGLYYAYLYYRPDGPDGRGPGGLEFPGGGEPALPDFVYFASAVATAFAVSDVRVTSAKVRKVVIGHSLLSFAYNAAILALAFGAVMGVLGGAWT